MNPYIVVDETGMKTVGENLIQKKLKAAKARFMLGNEETH
jgi:hypothetical protein